MLVSNFYLFVVASICLFGSKKRKGGKRRGGEIFKA
jgi:hypothetical protein